MSAGPIAQGVQLVLTTMLRPMVHTGDSSLDFALQSLLVTFLTFVTAWWSTTAVPWVFDKFQKKKLEPVTVIDTRWHTVTIKHTSVAQRIGYNIVTDNNRDIVNALILFVTRNVKDLPQAELAVDDQGNLVKTIPQETWIAITQDVELHIKEKILDEKVGDKVIEILLRSKISTQFIYDFLKSARKEYDEYKTEQRAIAAGTLKPYLYRVSEVHSQAMNGTRHELNPKRTFDRMFFEGKEDIIKLLDDFKKGSGIYEVLPVRRLNILLYGPPGTGKTSLIKAIANYMKRSIIYLPMAKIRTNGELFEAMYEKKISSYDGSSMYTAFNVDRKNAVVVLDEIDVGGRFAPRKNPTLAKLEGTNKEDEKEEKIQNILNLNEQLNLAGLLDALDGMHDIDDTLFIMTTNHISHLDEAITRPGRSFVVNMSHITPQNAEMIIKYLLRHIKFTDDCRTRLCKAMQGKTVTAAFMEELCARNFHSTTLDNLFSAIALSENSSFVNHSA